MCFRASHTTTHLCSHPWRRRPSSGGRTRQRSTRPRSRSIHPPCAASVYAMRMWVGRCVCVFACAYACVCMCVRARLLCVARMRGGLFACACVSACCVSLCVRDFGIQAVWRPSHTPEKRSADCTVNTQYIGARGGDSGSLVARKTIYSTNVHTWHVWRSGPLCGQNSSSPSPGSFPRQSPVCVGRSCRGKRECI